MPTGMALGAAENQAYSSQTLSIGTGDVIVIYTDGVTDSMNTQEKFFGEDRLYAIIKDSVALTAREILDRILFSVQEFSRDMPQFDDITLLVIKGT
jgi:sigma-B regulation protein RsbU (phosphoserine phosphatase)